MNVDWFARVVTLKTDRVCGTAYPVGDCRYLTAGHVAQLGEAYHLVWGQHVEKCRAEVVCTYSRSGTVANGELDVAVLQFVKSLKGSHPDGGSVLSSAPLRRTCAWETRGFPVVADVSNDWTRLDDMTGVAMESSSDQRFLSLTVDAAAESRQQQGFSGAPVFVGRRIVGVIAEPSQNYDGTKVLASPLHACFADPEFKAALGTERCDALHQRRCRVIRRLVPALTDAMFAFARMPSLGDVGRGWRDALEDGGNEALLDEFIATPVGELVDVFNRLHCELFHETPPSKGLATQVFDLICDLLPSLCWAQFQVREDAGVWFLPAPDARTAELFLAKDRAISYAKRRAIVHPSGEVRLPARLGIDVKAEFAFDEFVRSLHARWVGPVGVGFGSAEITKLNDDLKHLRDRHKGYQPYITVSEESSDWCDRFITRCREDLDGLLIVCLGRDDALAQLSRSLRDLWWRQHHDGKEWPEE